jgi:hypothetical protein
MPAPLSPVTPSVTPQSAALSGDPNASALVAQPAKVQSPPPTPVNSGGSAAFQVTGDLVAGDDDDDKDDDKQKNPSDSSRDDDELEDDRKKKESLNASSDGSSSLSKNQKKAVGAAAALWLFAGLPVIGQVLMCVAIVAYAGSKLYNRQEENRDSSSSNKQAASSANPAAPVQKPVQWLTPVNSVHASKVAASAPHGGKGLEPAATTPRVNPGHNLDV